MMLVRIVKDWDWPDLKRQTPGGTGVWDGIQFTLDDVEECDYLIMLNNRMNKTTKAMCPEDNIWVIMQEPYEKGFMDWVIEGHEHFAKVLTHHPLSKDPKYISSQPALPWHVNRTFDQLISCPIPQKTRGLSGIVGDAMDLPGHINRWKFIESLKMSGVPIDLFGKGTNFLEEKWDGLAPYRYSLALENNSGPDLWTEKLADCFLTWTLPFYYGCTNLEDYFPEGSFVRIDITKPEESINKIRSFIAADEWKKHISALNEARNLVLHRYQLFPYLSRLISLEEDLKKEKKVMILPPYRRSAKAFWHYCQFRWRRRIRKLKSKTRI
jgi:hypothetical protein